MNLLLDTHTLIWFAEGNEKLSVKSKELIENTKTKKIISIASFWEMAIKISLNKLSLNKSFKHFTEQVFSYNFEILPIFLEHLIILCDLDFHHKDPFDRVIISQAINEKLIVLSKDESFDLYGIKRIWK